MKKDVQIPAEGLPKSELLAAMKAMKGDDADWRSGRVWSLVHHGGGTSGELVALAREIRQAVFELFGIELRPEPVFLGFPTRNPLSGG